MAQDWADYLDRLAIGLVAGIPVDAARQAPSLVATISDEGTSESISI
jgi:hypothetical protein